LLLHVTNYWYFYCWLGAVIRRKSADDSFGGGPSQGFIEAAIARECAATTSYSASSSHTSPAFAVFAASHRIEKLITEPISNLCRSLYERAKGFVSFLLSSSSKIIESHHTLVVWVGGITIVAIAGAVAYTFWYRPTAADTGAVSAEPPAPILDQEQYNKLVLGADVDVEADIRDALGDLPTCVVCLDSFPRYACIQCGHLVLCQNDINVYTAKHGNNCPVCQGVTSFLLIRAP
jgi:hypothetical protein